MDWSKEEVSLIVNDYFEMLASERRHENYNKSEHRRTLSKLIPERRRAIEHKHRNISAAMINMGLPFIKGYKPLFRYQGVIEEVIENYIKKNKQSLEKVFDNFSGDSTQGNISEIDFEDIEAESPEPTKIIEQPPSFRPFKTNYLKKEQNNRKLGEEGEKLIVDYEKWRLRKAGGEKLINSIKWVSKDLGDGAGYDILSKNVDGSDRHIEVKTTKLSKETPIFLTKNEVSFSILYNHSFHLYRLFDFDTNPKFFIKQGEYSAFCKLKPETFRGYF